MKSCIKGEGSMQHLVSDELLPISALNSLRDKTRARITTLMVKHGVEDLISEIRECETNVRPTALRREILPEEVPRYRKSQRRVVDPKSPTLRSRKKRWLIEPPHVMQKGGKNEKLVIWREILLQRQPQSSDRILVENVPLVMSRMSVTDRGMNKRYDPLSDPLNPLPTLRTLKPLTDGTLLFWGIEHLGTRLPPQRVLIKGTKLPRRLQRELMKGANILWVGTWRRKTELADNGASNGERRGNITREECHTAYTRGHRACLYVVDMSLT
jgi:hypothetical protein